MKKILFSLITLFVFTTSQAVILESLIGIEAKNFLLQNSQYMNYLVTATNEDKTRFKCSKTTELAKTENPRAVVDFFLNNARGIVKMELGQNTDKGEVYSGQKFVNIDYIFLDNSKTFWDFFEKKELCEYYVSSIHKKNKGN